MDNTTRLLVIAVRIRPIENSCSHDPTSFTFLIPRVEKVIHKSTSLIRVGRRVGGGVRQHLCKTTEESFHLRRGIYFQLRVLFLGHIPDITKSEYLEILIYSSSKTDE